MRTGLLLAAAGLLAADLSAQGRVQRPMTFEDFAAVRNVSDPQVSPDGRWVLYSVRTTDVGANRRTSVTKLQPAAGGAPGGLKRGRDNAARAWTTLTSHRRDCWAVKVSSLRWIG